MNGGGGAGANAVRGTGSCVDSGCVAQLWPCTLSAVALCCSPPAACIDSPCRHSASLTPPPSSPFPLPASPTTCRYTHASLLIRNSLLSSPPAATPLSSSSCSSSPPIRLFTPLTACMGHGPSSLEHRARAACGEGGGQGRAEVKESAARAKASLMRRNSAGRTPRAQLTVRSRKSST